LKTIFSVQDQVQEYINARILAIKPGLKHQFIWYIDMKLLNMPQWKENLLGKGMKTLSAALLLLYSLTA
jgi:hypothetical protein